jgi:tRNA-2-methylthio-N6-dimethylallyladenosine synthase
MMKYNNICKYIHLPVQSGSTRVLQLMNRTYTREWYLAKVARIKELMPDCSISADIIAGFCTETEEDHQDTMSIMQLAAYDYAYMYFYSERPGTLAEKRYEDDVPLDVKKRRLQEIVDVQWHLSNESNKKELGKIYEVLIEGNSKKSDQEWMGRTSQNKVVVFPKSSEGASTPLVKGDYVNILITAYTKGTLMGTIK